MFLDSYVYYFNLNFSADIVKKCLEKNEMYSLILSEKQRKLLKDFVELLSIFEIFTKYVQGEYYPTLNTMILFRSEILEK